MAVNAKRAASRSMLAALAASLVVGQGAWAQTAPQGAPAGMSEIEESWAASAWRKVSPRSFYFSELANSAEYNDPSVKHPNPPPFTPAAQARYDEIRQAASEGRNIFDPPADCSWFGMPFILALQSFDMAFSKDRITMVYSGQGGFRRIWMDGRSHPEEIILPQFNGHSIGHWEGRTLVIDTVGLRGDRYVEPGMPFSEQMHVVERWTQTAPDQLSLEVVMTDPETFTRPWRVTRVYGRMSEEDRELDFMDFDCSNNRSLVIDGQTRLLGPNGEILN